MLGGGSDSASSQATASNNFNGDGNNLFMFAAIGLVVLLAVILGRK